MSQFTIYNSADAGAPTLNGTAGSLISVLDACLVNGYGAKAAAGWTKAFSGTNKAAYKMGAGTGFYLRVQDDAPHATALGREARVLGYETMTDVDTGSGSFGAFVSSSYGICRKSSTADATARSWMVFADSRTCYLFVLTGDSTGYYYTLLFGDIYSLASGDVWNCAIFARATENSSQDSVGGGLGTNQWLGQSGVNSATNGFAMARTFGGGAGAIFVGIHGDVGKCQIAGANQMSAKGYVPSPNGSDNAYYLSPIWVFEAASAVIRGRLRGIYHLLHLASGFSDGQTFNGANDYQGKSFQVVRYVTCTGLVGTQSGVVMETSDTLETN